MYNCANPPDYSKWDGVLQPLYRAAREDDHIKAVVLRVDSPGGSAFASELIRRGGGPLYGRRCYDPKFFSSARATIWSSVSPMAPTPSAS